MILAGVSFWLNILPGNYLNMIILCIGNACTHVSGAEVTLRASDGKLSHPAVFVAGGSFGLILGKLLATSSVPPYAILLFTLTAIPFALMGEKYKHIDVEACVLCEKFNFANPKLSKKAVIIMSTIIVIVRGYMGYGIPTTWKKTVLQGVILYFTMGIGKAMGGFLADAFGVKKIGIISAVAALPFLLIGDNYMMVSLLGVMLFSMTMSITLALLVSVLKDRPGYAFGFTTIGLFLGSVPIFFYRPANQTVNILTLVGLTVLCLIFMLIVIKKDVKTDACEYADIADFNGDN